MSVSRGALLLVALFAVSCFAPGGGEPVPGSQGSDPPTLVLRVGGTAYDGVAELRIMDANEVYPPGSGPRTEVNVAAALQPNAPIPEHTALTLRLHDRALDLREEVLNDQSVTGAFDSEFAYVLQNLEGESWWSTVVFEATGKAAGEFSLRFDDGRVSGSFDAEIARGRAPEDTRVVHAEFNGPLTISCFNSTARASWEADTEFTSELCAPFRDIASTGTAP